jgi:hypothetical protein
MNICNHRVGICNHRMGTRNRLSGIRNHRVGICNHSVGSRNRLLGICNYNPCIGNRHLGIRNHKVGVDCQLCLKETAKFANAQRVQRTHIEDMKDLDKVLLPSSNLILITLREDEPGECIPFTLLHDLPLDPCQGSAIQTFVSGSFGVYRASLV